VGAPPSDPSWVRPASLRLGALVVLSLVIATGCASSGPAGSSSGPVVDVTERDFTISAPASIPAGDVTLAVHNQGPDEHELIVVRSTRLPLRRDGLTVDEGRVRQATLGLLEPGQPGSVRYLNLHLLPGHYVLFCNMYGHYMGGMHRSIVVQ
jgi:hypothetical protein